MHDIISRIDEKYVFLSKVAFRRKYNTFLWSWAPILHRPFIWIGLFFFSNAVSFDNIRHFQGHTEFVHSILGSCPWSGLNTQWAIEFNSFRNVACCKFWKYLTRKYYVMKHTLYAHVLFTNCHYKLLRGICSSKYGRTVYSLVFAVNSHHAKISPCVEENVYFDVFHSKKKKKR